MTRVLAYIEPAVFRQNPLFLLPHVQWVRMLACALGLKSGDRLLLLSSSAVCRAAHPILSAALPDCSLEFENVPVSACLAAFNGSVSAYARDLYAPAKSPVRNEALVGVLEQVVDEFLPDLVLVTAENRYLAALARQRAVSNGIYFIEKAPLPSGIGFDRLYFDDRGHQSNGTLAECWQFILQARYENSEIAAAQTLLAQLSERQQRADGVALRHLVHQACDPARETMIVALQPADWLSWEGALPDAIDPFGLLGRCCASFPDLNILPTFHRDMPALRSDALSNLKAIYPNLVDVSSERLVGCTEDLLPMADHVYTVSSAVGVTALLQGKCLVSDADSFLRSAAVDSTSFQSGRRGHLDVNQRECLAAFLLGRFSKPINGLRSLSDYRQHAAGLARVVRPAGLPAAASSPETKRESDIRRARFGVLEFSYRGFVHFGRTLDTDGSYRVNLGDYIQSRAVREALHAIGVHDDQITTIDRDSLATYDGDSLLLVMNSVFTIGNFPLAEAITPVYFGFSFHPDNLLPGQTSQDYEAALRHLRPVGSIGCRDRATADALAARGFASHVTGCLSQSLAPRTFQGEDHDGAVLFCGIDDSSLEQELLRQSKGSHFRLRDQRYRVTEYPLSSEAMSACRHEADALISLYARHVKLVVTSLMHCASPCAAMGIPAVIVRRDPNNIRFSSLREHLQILAPSEVSGLEQLQREARILQLRGRMLDRLRSTVEEALRARAAR